MKTPAGAWLLLMLPALLGVDLWRASNKNVEQGNAKLLEGQAKEALELYDKALAEDGLADPQARAAAEFNRGAALSALKQNDEAAQAFLEATKSKDVSLRARAFYNLGNTFFQGEKFAEAVEAYKRSLVLNSKNADAKWNLELALRSKREQDEKNEKDKQDKGDQSKDKQDKGDQDKGDQDKGDQDKGDQDKQDDNGQKQPPADDKSEQKQDQGDQDESGKDPNEDKQPPGPNDEGSEPPPEPQPQESAPPEQGQKGQEGQAEAADMKEINAILDSLEQSPQEMERQRARMRAVRRRPPVKDW